MSSHVPPAQVPCSITLILVIPAVTLCTIRNHYSYSLFIFLQTLFPICSTIFTIFIYL
uniref:Uncharacterized protein n=1 Tax=Octopus bimaculoides TaxID=37653 RepID=A0A0L8HG06_OCTBM